MDREHGHGFVLLAACNQVGLDVGQKHLHLFAGDSNWLLTAGQDSSVRLWDVQHGEQLFIWESNQPARACAFAKADPHLAVYTTDQFSTTSPSIRFVRIAEVPQQTDPTPTLQIDITRKERCSHPCACCR
jgi:WD40 repeat protein